MKCALHNMGCKVNSYETDAMTQLLSDAGYEIVGFGEETADIYIINTCTVTNIADRKSRQMLHRAKKENPEAIIVAAGCYVQESEKELLDDECVDILVGNNKKSEIVDILKKYFEDRDGSNVIDIAGQNEYEELAISESSTHTRAYIKIQDGCNQFCSYCIIPFARGRVRSRKADDIFDEVKRLARSGCKEIVLTGIHLSSYGLDFENKEYNRQEIPDGSHLLGIIKGAAAIEGIERIRLGSLEPRIVTEEFVRELAAVRQLCPHFHLSLQSGCDETLKRMNRRYTSDDFMKGVMLLRKYFDNPAITTDVITGFPGETDEEFEISRKFVESVKFYDLHVFKFSRRKGTVADRMKGQLIERVKAERSDVLISHGIEESKAYRSGYIGKNEEVLVEEYIEVDGNVVACGHTTRYIKVIISAEVLPGVNSLVKVTVTGLYGDEGVKAVVAG